MASRLQDVILRGTAAARPAASGIAPGTLYYSTDTAVTERRADASATWETYSDAGTATGKLVQVVTTLSGAVATGTTGIPFDNTIPQITEGNEYLTATITPASSSNKLRIDVVVFGTVDGPSWHIVALFQDATANALAATADYQTVSTAGGPVSFTHSMTAGTTSATTFRVRAGRDSAGGTTFTFNGQSAGRIFGGVMASSLIITETTP